jgi:hypothetical protein
MEGLNVDDYGDDVTLLLAPTLSAIAIRAVTSQHASSLVMTGTVSFTSENVVFRQQMQRPRDVTRAMSYSKTAAQCLQRVRQNKAFSILYSQQANGTDEVQLIISYNLIGNLPVLKDLWDSTAPAVSETADSDDGADAQATAERVLRGSEHTVPFSPPSSLWALASVLLILEGRLNFWHWLGSPDGDPRLAADTLTVRTSSVSAVKLLRSYSVSAMNLSKSSSVSAVKLSKPSSVSAVDLIRSFSVSAVKLIHLRCPLK